MTVTPNSTGNVIDFTGMNIQQITDATRNAVKGLDPNVPDDNKKIRQLLRLTMMELIEKFEAEGRANPYDDAIREIELIRKSLSNAVKTTGVTPGGVTPGKRPRG